jgi:hypothetical protein
MGERRKSSALFSLTGLLDLDPARFEREAAAWQRAVDQARSEREQRDQRALAEQCRLGRRQQDERLDAVCQALTEQARIASEGRARLELAEKQHAHERRMAEARAQLRRRHDRIWATVGLILAAAVTLAAAGVYLGKLRPEARRLQVAYDGLVAAERERAQAAERLLVRVERQNRALSDELTRTERKLERAEKNLPCTNGAAPLPPHIRTPRRR